MNYFVWTDADLDGASSYLCLKWVTGIKIPYKVTTAGKFREEFLNWSLKNKLSDFDKVFILDMDVSDSVDLVDHENVVIIDHHTSHVANKNYKHCKAIVEEYTSCVKLIYKKFKKDLEPLKKLLILMCDDYDSYQLKVPNSLDLNTVFWTYSGDRVEKFIADFGKGFTGFTDQHKNMIQYHNKKKKDITDTLVPYVYNTVIKGETVKMVGVMADYAINEIADYTRDTYKADIVFIINTKFGTVSFRKREGCNVSLDKLAYKLAGGGGHEYAAGGKLNDTFMSFLKLCTPL